jgi:UDP-N-acetylmuramyl pentapeptide phosphotransferase/UDP-N-acetylglucosamine-1-phosphate transferase
MEHILMVAAAALLGWGLTGIVLYVVRQSQHRAMPSSRGLHKVPTPVGGGLGLISAALIMWALSQWPLLAEMVRIVAAIFALAALSWLDDRRPLPPAIRFAAQALVIVATLWWLPMQQRLLPVVPLGVERCAIAIGWLWMLNLTNFMDGIDGLAGIEAVSVGLGYAVCATLFVHDTAVVAQLPDLALFVAAASIGYLVWNWAPAQIFMGDVGSIPLGFLFGLLMFDLSERGDWAAAIILPLYFIADATTTLLDRIRRGIRPWHAHREHAYQHAVLAGMSHAEVSLHVGTLNVALGALAVLSHGRPWTALLAAVVLTFGLLYWFRARSIRA